jgi:hypothetical protein
MTLSKLTARGRFERQPARTYLGDGGGSRRLGASRGYPDAAVHASLLSSGSRVLEGQRKEDPPHSLRRRRVRARSLLGRGF